MIYINVGTAPISALAHALLMLEKVFESANLEIQVVHNFVPNAINLVFDGYDFSDDDTSLFLLKEIKLGIILTEQLEIRNGYLEYNSNRWWRHRSGKSDPHTNTQRLFSLLRMVPFCDYLLILGDTFDKSSLQEIFPSKSILQVPFPILKPRNLNQVPFFTSDYVVSFPGGAPDSKYRINIINQLKALGCNIRIIHEHSIINYGNQIALSKINLHIPKSNHWKYTSPLRTFVSIYFGVQPAIFLRNRTEIKFSEIDQLQLFVTYENFSDSTKNLIRGNDLINLYNSKFANRYNANLLEDLVKNLI